MKNMVYERKMDTTEDRLQQIFDAAGRFSDTTVLHKIKLSIDELVRCETQLTVTILIINYTEIYILFPNCAVS
jgi:hypothetical protein